MLFDHHGTGCSDDVLAAPLDADCGEVRDIVIDNELAGVVDDVDVFDDDSGEDESGEAQGTTRKDPPPQDPTAKETARRKTSKQARGTKRKRKRKPRRVPSVGFLLQLDFRKLLPQ